MDLIESSSSDEEEMELIPARIFRERLNWEELTDNLFKQRFRLSRQQAEILLNDIGRDIDPIRMTNYAINSWQKLLIFLRFMATGDIFLSVGDAEHVSKSTAWRAVKNVRNAIISHYHGIISWPNGEQACRNVAQQFFRQSSRNGQMPGMVMTIGALDASLIPIVRPAEHEDQYVRGQKGHNIILQAVSGPDLSFFSVSTKSPGVYNDARAFRVSKLYNSFQNEGFRPFPNCILVADKQYPLLDWVLPNRRVGPEFNELFRAHSRARAIVENSFALLKNRWEILKEPMRMKVPKEAALTLKCATLLHNFCLRTNPDDHAFHPADHDLEENLDMDQPPDPEQMDLINYINHLFLNANGL